MKSYGVAVYKYQALRVVGHNRSQRISPVGEILQGIGEISRYVEGPTRPVKVRHRAGRVRLFVGSPSPSGSDLPA